MLSPGEAHQRLVAEGRDGMDDPTEPTGPPKRWYFRREDGVLCRAGWRDPCPTAFPEFRRPAQVSRA